MIGLELVFQLIDTSCIIMILVIELAQYLADKHSRTFSESMVDLTLPTMAVDVNSDASKPE
jgi:hypothetical protein